MGIIELVDILIVATLLWLGLIWLRATRARLALLGLSIMVGVYVLASRFELSLTARILEGFFAVSVIVVVVVFQEDLRRLFERIAVLGLGQSRRRSAPDVIDAVVSAVDRLARNATGALLVIPGREPLTRHVEGGVYLRGRVSEPLLMSLFDPHSPGHDGAAVIEGNEVTRFGGHLPLSVDHDALGQRGTRHAAALGLAERTDALCIVVSEERGIISVAVGGRIRELADAAALEIAMRDYLARSSPTSETSPSLPSRLGANWKEAVVSLVVAVGLWSLLVPGSSVARVEQSVKIAVENLPEGFDLVGIEPAEVNVTIEGLRRDVLLADYDRATVRVDALLSQLGRRTFEVGPELVDLPEPLTAISVEPRQVKLDLQRKQPS